MLELFGKLFSRANTCFVSYIVANMEQNKEKIRHILQYYYDKGKNGSHAANKTCAVYGSDTVSISTAQRWFHRFRSGAEVIEDAPRELMRIDRKRPA